MTKLSSLDACRALALLTSLSLAPGLGCSSDAPLKSGSESEDDDSVTADEDDDVQSDEGPASPSAQDAGGPATATPSRDAGAQPRSDGGRAPVDAGNSCEGQQVENACVPDPDSGPLSDGGKGPIPQGDASTPVDPNECQVGPVPADVRTNWKLTNFYQKYASANGIPIASSDKPPDKTLTLACQLVNEMTSKRPDVREALIKNRTHFTIIAMVEKTTDTPEYANLPDYYNTRARGLGGDPGQCSEESILCDPSDRWRGESICVHEYAHTISIYGMYTADKTFEGRLKSTWQAAMSKGLWANTYATENEQEYWGEIVQSYYNTNLEARTPNGVHGPIDKRDELMMYDPEGYKLVQELIPDVTKWTDCYKD